MPAPDLVRREFAAPVPDLLWLADITYVKTDEGFLYLAFVLDAHSRRLVGWSMVERLRTELVVDALEMALWRREPGAGLIHHTDRGSQYTALSFGKRLAEVGIRPLDGPNRIGAGQHDGRVVRLDLEGGVGGSSPLSHREAARVAIFEYVEGFYNRTRRHSALGCESPVDYEAATMEEAVVA